jgi:hypothetical protein
MHISFDFFPNLLPQSMQQLWNIVLSYFHVVVFSHIVQYFSLVGGFFIFFGFSEKKRFSFCTPVKEDVRAFFWGKDFGSKVDPSESNASFSKKGVLFFVHNHDKFMSLFSLPPL